MFKTIKNLFILIKEAYLTFSKWEQNEISKAIIVIRYLIKYRLWYTLNGYEPQDYDTLYKACESHYKDKQSFEYQLYRNKIEIEEIKKDCDEAILKKENEIVHLKDLIQAKDLIIAKLENK